MTGRPGENDKSVGWNWKSGVYNVLLKVHIRSVLHFNMNIGGCPAVQFCVNYKNGGISYLPFRRATILAELDWTGYMPQRNHPQVLWTHYTC